MFRRSGASLCVLAALCLAGPGCKDQSGRAVTQPADRSPGTPPPGGAAPPAPASTPARVTQTGTAAEPEKPAARTGPARPAPGWTIFREAFEDKADSTCLTRWTGEHRLEIRTENIRVLTLDVTKLPKAAPRDDGPWNLQIDGQGIDITGLRGGRRVLDLVRSQNGDWRVVSGSHRTKP